MPSIISVGDLVGDARPDVDDLVVALAVGDEPLLVLLDDALDLLLRLAEEDLLRRRDHHVIHADRDARPHRVVEAERAEPVREEDGLLVAVDAVADVDERRERLLVEGLVRVLERDPFGRTSEMSDAAHRGLDDAALHVAELVEPRVAVVVDDRDAHADAGVERDLAVVVRHPHLLGGGVDAAQVALRYAVLADGERVRAEATLLELALAGRVVEPEHDVLRRVDDRLAVRGREDVVRAHHEHARLHLRLDRQRHVDRHLVAVEVGVERRADQRVQLDRLALDEDRLERLDAEAVERRGAVQEHRVLADDLLEDVPDLGRSFSTIFLALLMVLT